MGEDGFLANMFGGMDLYIDNKKVGTVTDIKDSSEDSHLSQSEKKVMDNIGTSQKTLTFNVDDFGSVMTALKDISTKTLAQEADESMNKWFNNHNNEMVTDPELYAIKVEDLIEQFPTNILLEIREKILIKHPNLIIADFKDFRASFHSTGCVIRNSTSLSSDLTHLDVIDSNGYVIKVEDPKSEFQLSNGQFLVIKY